MSFECQTHEIGQILPKILLNLKIPYIQQMLAFLLF